MSLKRRKTSDDLQLNDNWKVYRSKSFPNRVFYYNSVTKETTWENPCKRHRKDHETERVILKAKRKKHISKTEGLPLSASKTDKNYVSKYSVRGEKYEGINDGKRHQRSSQPSSSLDEKSSSGTAQILQKMEYSEDEKNARSRSPSQKSVISEVDVNTVRPRSTSYSTTSIKKREKTPAQNSLLRKRKIYEALVKKGLSAPFGPTVSLNVITENERNKYSKITPNDESKHPNSCCSDFSVRKQLQEELKDKLKNGSKEEEEKTSEFSQKERVDSKFIDDYSLCCDEEMDWEPSEQEVMIEHIKSLRENLGNARDISDNIRICFTENTGTDWEEDNLILVFDTNVFISCLAFIKEIRDTCIPGLGLPRIYIPWRVLQELDHLKISDDKQLQISARRAIRYLNENFSSRHPRMSGQSVEEVNMMSGDSPVSPDDEILKTCLNLKRKDNCRAVVLITNDANLESKAIVSGLFAFSKDRFVKEKLKDSNNRNNQKEKHKIQHVILENDKMYCKLKNVLTTFLEQVLETEFIAAFDGEWQRVVAKKPPWTIMEIFYCMTVHWTSVFSFVFKRDVLILIEELKEYFAKAEKGKNELIPEIIQVSKELLRRLRDLVTREKAYSTILDKTITEVEMLMESEEEPNKDSVQETAMSNSSLTPSPSPSIMEPQNVSNAESPVFDRAVCKSKVKNLFQIIWDQVKNFSCTVSELAATNGMSNPEAVSQVKDQIPHVMRSIQELANIVEKILSLGPEDGAQAEQIILHFTNFLIGLNVFHIDPSELNNLPAYIGLFCGDDDGRFVLCTLVNDLKQFAQGIVSAMNSFELLGT